MEKSSKIDGEPLFNEREAVVLTATDKASAASSSASISSPSAFPDPTDRNHASIESSALQTSSSETKPKSTKLSTQTEQASTTSTPCGSTPTHDAGPAPPDSKKLATPQNPAADHPREASAATSTIAAEADNLPPPPPKQTVQAPPAPRDAPAAAAADTGERHDATADHGGGLTADGVLSWRIPNGPTPHGGQHGRHHHSNGRRSDGGGRHHARGGGGAAAMLGQNPVGYNYSSVEDGRPTEVSPPPDGGAAPHGGGGGGGGGMRAFLPRARALSLPSPPPTTFR
jgi:hypothetical protein